MNFENLIVADVEGVTEITINRPERRNALSLAVMAELETAVRQAQGGAVVIGGAGTVFSAGHDLAEMVGESVSFYREVFEACTQLMESLQSAPQPVIAKVRGVATAAGCQLVAACDLAIAGEGARFATPGVRIGLFCSTPMVPLSRAIGRKRAMQMLLTGDFVDAATAADWGLVNDVVPDDELDEAACTLARRIAEASPLVLGMGKEAFYRQVDLDQRQAYDLTRNVMSLNAMTADAQEGMGAFLEKRQPRWTGC